MAETLKRGDHGAAVIELQDAFVKIGWLKANYVDGYFGPDLEELVKRVQKMAVITPDGIVGPKTRVALDGLVTQAEVK